MLVGNHFAKEPQTAINSQIGYHILAATNLSHPKDSTKKTWTWNNHFHHRDASPTKFVPKKVKLVLSTGSWKQNITFPNSPKMVSKKWWVQNQFPSPRHPVIFSNDDWGVQSLTSETLFVFSGSMKPFSGSVMGSLGPSVITISERSELCSFLSTWHQNLRKCLLMFYRTQPW